MGKEKICIISQGAYPLLVNSSGTINVGGAEVQLVTLGKHLAKIGYYVCFFVGEFGQPKYLEIDGDFCVRKVPLRYMGGSNLFLFPDWINLLISLWKTNADIHLLKLPGHLLFPIGIYCKFFRKKQVFICQIDRDVKLSDLKSSANLFEYWFYRIGLMLTEHVVCQNKDQLHSLRKFYSGKATAIRNVVSFNEPHQLAKQKYILWVGSNLPRKRPMMFIELAERCPELSFKMIMSTTNQIPDDSDIRNQCSRIGNIEYIGSVPFHEIGKYFQAASILVSTSELEGFPNIFLQAWQCETPVVSLSIDPDGIITRHDLGRVAGSIEKIVTDIKELMSDDDLRAKLGYNAKNYVRKYHSPEIIMNEYCNLLNSLLVT
jgi:glycosyltransferase involved in cell wall biosynthesis